MFQRTNKESQEAVGSVEQVSTETDHRNLSAFHTEPNRVHLGCELMKIKGLIRIILSADWWQQTWGLLLHTWSDYRLLIVPLGEMRLAWLLCGRRENKTLSTGSSGPWGIIDRRLFLFSRSLTEMKVSILREKWRFYIFTSVWSGAMQPKLDKEEEIDVPTKCAGCKVLPLETLYSVNC